MADTMSEQKERDELEKAYQVLESYGVPRERARNVPNGIMVLVARMDKEVAALRLLLVQERERCAKVCDEEGNEWDSDALITHKNYAHACRDRIRVLPDPTEGLEEARRVVEDAERYRYLRNNVEESNLPTNALLLVYQGPTSDYSLLPDELDAAIDAARAKKP